MSAIVPVARAEPQTSPPRDARFCRPAWAVPENFGNWRRFFLAGPPDVLLGTFLNGHRAGGGLPHSWYMLNDLHPHKESRP